MSKLRVLNFQYHILKRLTALSPAKWRSAGDRQVSDLAQCFQPNVDEMRRVFHKIDSDGDGRISIEELRSSLAAIGRKDAAAAAESMMRIADLNKSGFIEFEELMEVHPKGVTRNDIKMAFWVFDENRDGRIGAEEVMSMLQRLGERCSLEHCRRMVKNIDKSGVGLVGMDDFMAMMTRTMKPL